RQPRKVGRKSAASLNTSSARSPRRARSCRKAPIADARVCNAPKVRLLTTEAPSRTDAQGRGPVDRAAGSRKISTSGVMGTRAARPAAPTQKADYRNVFRKDVLSEAGEHAIADLENGSDVLLEGGANVIQVALYRAHGRLCVGGEVMAGSVETLG